MFKMTISDVQSASDEIDTIDTTSGDVADDLKVVNDNFFTVMLGAFSAAANATNICIENNLRIFVEALTNLHNNYESLIAEASGTLVSDRDAILAVVGGSGDSDYLYFDDGNSVIGDIGYARADVDKLQTGVQDALDSLAGLDTPGNIQTPLDALMSDIPNQFTKLDDLTDTFETFATAVSDFESNWSAALAEDKFITDDMLDKVEADMKDNYENIPAVEVFNFLKDTRKQIKNIEGKPAKVISALLDYSNTKFWGVINTDGPGVAGYLSYVARHPSEFADKWGEKMTGFLDPDAWKDDIKGFLGETDDIADGMSATKQAASQLDHFSGIVDKCGDVLEVAGIGIDTYEAFDTTQGDVYDKAGAAVSTAAFGIGHFAGSKAIGAAVGMCVGGPLGAIVGVAAGYAFDYVWNNYIATDEVKEDAGKGIGNFFRNVFGGGKNENEAFAAG
ncbi:MAG: hypothetical protein ACOYIK_02215 [Coriobacteriales bacterium]|jgi:hypothetical protein